MDSQNPYRIPSLSTVTSISRQTPNNDFGTVMARTVSEGLSRTSAVFGPLITATPVLNTAVQGAQHVTATVISSGNGVLPVTSPSGPTYSPSEANMGASGLGGRGEQWELLEAQRLLQQQSNSFNAQYLGLQNEIQRESREYNTVSNIMKVRHDSAKSAINNIR
jgi:hypothetical protein